MERRREASADLMMLLGELINVPGTARASLVQPDYLILRAR